MKFEINLDEIIGNETSIRDEVIRTITDRLQKGIKTAVDEEIGRVITVELSKVVEKKMPELIDNLMNEEYTPVDRWGDRNKKTTFRAELVKQIHENMVYKKDGYNDAKNAFTKAVDSVISSQLDGFKKEFNSKIDAEFTREAMNFATTKLKERLGIK